MLAAKLTVALLVLGAAVAPSGKGSPLKRQNAFEDELPQKPTWAVEEEEEEEETVNVAKSQKPVEEGGVQSRGRDVQESGKKHRVRVLAALPPLLAPGRILAHASPSDGLSEMPQGRLNRLSAKLVSPY